MRVLGHIVVVGCIGALGCAGESRRLDEVDQAHQQVLFGDDDRADTYTIAAPAIAALARSCPALVPASRLDLTDPTQVKLAPLSLTSRFGVCADERFASQPAVADCAGTLVTPDTVLTAGHCISPSSCEGTRILFDYVMAPDGLPRPIPTASVYSCAEVVVHRLDSVADYAMVRLDRPVTDRSPVSVRVGALPVAAGTPLLTVGYPSGLPQKVASNATVNDPRPDSLDYFTAHLDSLPGNSGGGVFDLDTNKLVGVLVRGPSPAYVNAGEEACFRAVQVSDDSTQQIESVYVAAAVRDFCNVVYDPVLCVCGNGLCEPGMQETTASCPKDCGSLCGDSACNGTETADNCYGDCGRCGNAICENSEIARLNCCEDCGCPSGFSCDASSCQPQLGNLNGDEAVDRQDVAALRVELLANYPPPHSTAAADVDCSGKTDWEDLRALRRLVEGKDSQLPCARVASLAVGGDFACAAFASGNVRCWGINDFGQLGSGSTEVAKLGAANAENLSLGCRAIQVAASRGHSCALSDTGRVKCWGSNDVGQLGYGNSIAIGDSLVPSDVGWVELSGPALQLALGGRSSCAVLKDGRVQCWGDNSFGQLGYGHQMNVGDDETPASQGAISFGNPVVEVAMGEMHACARLASGAVHCWGSNMMGQIGSGSPLDVGDDELASEAPAIGLGGAAKTLSVGATHSCAVLVSGELRCWGDNMSGQLGILDPMPIGDDETPDSIGPVAVGAGVVAGVAAGDWRTCVRYEDGNIRCWGENSHGELGLGNTDSLSLWMLPEELPLVDVGAPAVGLVSAFGQTCAQLGAGDMRCWGPNDYGQLGYKHRSDIGDDEAPASAGNVRLTGVNDAGWSFVNSKNLEVWLENESTDSQGVSMSLLVRNSGNQIVSDISARMLFDTSEGAGQMVELYTSDRNRSELFFEREPNQNLCTLRFEFSGGKLSPSETKALRWYHGEHFELGYSNGSSIWNSGNDYSAADQPFRGRRYRTQRVQIVDRAGAIVYGWRRDSGK